MCHLVQTAALLADADVRDGTQLHHLILQYITLYKVLGGYAICNLCTVTNDPMYAAAGTHSVAPVSSVTVMHIKAESDNLQGISCSKRQRQPHCGRPGGA